METKIRLYEADRRALEQGITATLSIQFVEEADGKMSVLSAAVLQGYDCCDYSCSLDTTLGEIIKDLIR